jgi:hypothetical protein
LKDIQEGVGFPDHGAAHQEGFINKLVVQDRRGDTMQGKTCQEFGFNCCMVGPTKALDQDNEQKRREGISLPDSSIGGEGIRWDAINEKREERRRG